MTEFKSFIKNNKRFNCLVYLDNLNRKGYLVTYNKTNPLETNFYFCTNNARVKPKDLRPFQRSY